jgi:hypothetical protein
MAAATAVAIPVATPAHQGAPGQPGSPDPRALYQFVPGRGFVAVTHPSHAQQQQQQQQAASPNTVAGDVLPLRAVVSSLLRSLTSFVGGRSNDYAPVPSSMEMPPQHMQQQAVMGQAPAVGPAPPQHQAPAGSPMAYAVPIGGYGGYPPVPQYQQQPQAPTPAYTYAEPPRAPGGNGGGYSY